MNHLLIRNACPKINQYSPWKWIFLWVICNNIKLNWKRFQMIVILICLTYGKALLMLNYSKKELRWRNKIISMVRLILLLWKHSTKFISTNMNYTSNEIYMPIFNFNMKMECDIDIILLMISWVLNRSLLRSEEHFSRCHFFYFS